MHFKKTEYAVFSVPPKGLDIVYPNGRLVMYRSYHGWSHHLHRHYSTGINKHEAEDTTPWNPNVTIILQFTCHMPMAIAIYKAQSSIQCKTPLDEVISSPEKNATIQPGHVDNTHDHNRILDSVESPTTPFYQTLFTNRSDVSSIVPFTLVDGIGTIHGETSVFAGHQQ